MNDIIWGIIAMLIAEPTSTSYDNNAMKMGPARVQLSTPVMLSPISYWKSKHRPTPPFCAMHSNRQLAIDSSSNESFVSLVQQMPSNSEVTQ